MRIGKLEIMEGRIWENGENELGEIKKGPWKVEEDEVLLNHVNKYGPRNWSSIRSKGLLQRTGKSCRLRWVNKLRPNLKNGVKFSAEEERIVIDLQAQFGNKWAKIATYLPGRTDNDVKNFWSSRQKRLARILHNSTPQSSKSQGDNNGGSSVKEVAALHDVPSLEAPQFRSSTYEESLSKPQSCSSSYIDNFEAFPMLDLMNPTSLTFEPNLLQLEYTPCETKPFNGSKLQLPFPQIPQVQTDFPLPLEGQDFSLRSGDLYCSDVFGNGHASEPERSCLDVVNSEVFGNASALEPERSCLDVVNSDVFRNASAPEPERSCLDAVNSDVFGNASAREPERSCVQDVVKQETDAMINPVSPDSFSDEFPIDMFDHIEPLPSPSDW